MGMTRSGLAPATTRGAFVGVGLIVPTTVLAALTGADTNGEESGWRIPLFFLVLVAFAIAGWVGGRSLPESRLTAGMLAGLGALALWLPLRVLVWVLRGDDRGLVTGTDAILRPGQLFTAALFASALGLLGGLIGGGGATRLGDPGAS